MENSLLSVIIFAPLAGAAINWLVGRRLRNEKMIGLIACGSVGISTLVAFYRRTRPALIGWRRIAALAPDVQPSTGMLANFISLIMVRCRCMVER